MFPPQTLIRMQIIDNALVLHNMDEKSSQIYDFKIADYASPLINSNLEVDSSFAMKGAYVSDLIFPEEQENESESAFKGLRGLTEQATSIFHATANSPGVSTANQTSAGEDGSSPTGGNDASNTSSSMLATEPMKSGPENSKEFVELNF